MNPLNPWTLSNKNAYLPCNRVQQQLVENEAADNTSLLLVFASVGVIPGELFKMIDKGLTDMGLRCSNRTTYLA